MDNVLGRSSFKVSLCSSSCSEQGTKYLLVFVAFEEIQDGVFEVSLDCGFDQNLGASPHVARLDRNNAPATTVKH